MSVNTIHVFTEEKRFRLNVKEKTCAFLASRSADGALYVVHLMENGVDVCQQVAQLPQRDRASP